jgi:hypothetical protein
MPGDGGAGGQLKDQTAICLFVEGEIKAIGGLERIAKLGLLATTLQQQVGTTRQFVVDQAGDQVQGRHGFGLSLTQACFQHGGHAAKTQLF